VGFFESVIKSEGGREEINNKAGSFAPPLSRYAYLRKNKKTKKDAIERIIKIGDVTK
jgi:hypothetical protein